MSNSPRRKAIKSRQLRRKQARADVQAMIRFADSLGPPNHPSALIFRREDWDIYAYQSPVFHFDPPDAGC